MNNDNIEATANELDEPINLLDILGDEIRSLYTNVNAIKRAKTETEQQQARNLLAFDIQNRIGRMETLTSVANQLVTARQDELLNASEPVPKSTVAAKKIVKTLNKKG